MSIAAILHHKGPEVVTVAPTMSLREAAETLATHRIGAVLVTEPGAAGEAVRGVLSERDIVRAMAIHGGRALDLPVTALMTTEVVAVSRATPLAEAMRVMTEGRFRHLPVMDGTALVGIVSIGDVVKAVLMRQELEVETLKAYVAGTG